MIIDFHTHTFPDKIAGSVIGKLQQLSRSRPFTDATNDGLRRSMEQAGIDLSILLPVMTNAGQVHKLNDLAARINERWQETGLLSFGGMHPDVENYKEALNHVTELGLKGIKIHPAYQGADFDDIRYLRIIDKASELGLIVLTHAGWDTACYAVGRAGSSGACPYGRLAGLESCRRRAGRTAAVL